MFVKTFVNDEQLNRLNKFADIVGKIAKTKKHYKGSLRKAMKLYISETFNVKRGYAKTSIVPDLDFSHRDPYVNCYFKIDDPIKDKDIKLQLCQMLVDCGKGVNGSKVETYDYYFGTIKIFAIPEISTITSNFKEQ